MRFYKSKTICKGLKVSASKSGLRLGVGVPGLSISVGKSGTYLNTGIPGLGISNRTKISGGNKSRNTTYVSNGEVVTTKITIHKDDKTGKLTFYDDEGRLITNESLIRKIKRSSSYHTEVNRMEQEWREMNFKEIEKVNTKNQNIINICSLSAEVHDRAYYESIRDKLMPKKYTTKSFNENPPVKEEIRVLLENEAKEKVRTWKIWGIKKLRDQYVNSNINSQFEIAINNWEKRKRRFYSEEDAKVEKLNNDAQLAYEKQLELINKILSCDKETVTNEIDNAINGIELTLDFNLQYDIRDNGKVVYVDLDLPEIEMLPQESAVQLTSGKIKMKKKSQKELKQDYVRCVFSFAIFFASIIFSAATCIEETIISGYTQRRNKLGDINDEYVYSIKFKRSKMLEVKCLK